MTRHPRQSAVRFASIIGALLAAAASPSAVLADSAPEHPCVGVDPLGTPEEVAARLRAIAAQYQHRGGTMDIGNIAVIEDDGLMVGGPAGGNETNTINIVNAFFQTHGDEYDEIMIHVASTYPFDVEPESGFAFFQSVAGFTAGINRTQGNNNESLGRTRLAGFCNMNDLPEYPEDPILDFFNNNVGSHVEIAGHEFGHQFLSFVQPHASTGGDILGRANAHWSFFLHHPGIGNASPMEGNRWFPAIGGFESVESFTGYSDLDEYLMGLRPAPNVSPFYVIDFDVDPFPDSRFPATGVVVDGQPINLTVQDIIDRHGPRGPTVATSMKRFRVAIVLVIPFGTTATAADINKLETFRLAFEDYFHDATEELGTMDTSLGLPPSVDVSVFAPADDFESGAFDLQRYEWVQGATIDELALNEPSGVRSMHFDGNWGGGDEVRSMPVDLSAHDPASVILRMQVQRTGGGDSPEAGEDLLLEYFDNDGGWIELRRVTGAGDDETTFSPLAAIVPTDGLHAQFRFRLRRLQGTVGPQDDFFIDDVALLDRAACPADLTDDGTWNLPDGVIDASDVIELFGNWNTSAAGSDLAPPDDVVDVFDLIDLLSAWGDCT